MGESVFGNMAYDLVTDHAGQIVESVEENQYNQWQREFVWDALQNQRFGQSFCKAFDIKDAILYYERDWVRADAYIRRNYIARP